MGRCETLPEETHTIRQQKGGVTKYILQNILQNNIYKILRALSQRTEKAKDFLEKVLDVALGTWNKPQIKPLKSLQKF